MSGGNTSRKGTTNSGRIILKNNGEEPCSARANKEYYQLWKFLEDLTLEELQFLVTKRKNDLKYESSIDKIRILRTEILIIEDCYKITKRKEMEVKK